METMYSAWITAGASILAVLLSAILSYIFQGRSIDKKLEQLLPKVDGLVTQHIKGESGLSKEHKDIHYGLSGEHSDLSKEHGSLLAETKAINKTADDTNKVVRIIDSEAKREQERNLAAYTSLSKEHQNVADVLKDAGIAAGGLQKELLDMRGQLSQLETKVRQLTDEKQDLVHRNDKLVSKMNAMLDRLEQKQDYPSHSWNDDEPEL